MTAAGLAMVAPAALRPLRELLERLERLERELGHIVEDLPHGTFPDDSLDAGVECAFDGVDVLIHRVRRRLELEEKVASRWTS